MIRDRMPDLKVIPGGGCQLPSWLNFPQVTEVRCHFDRDRLGLVRVATERALRSAAAARRQPTFELWSLALGTAPPVNNVAHESNQPTEEGLSRLVDAQACFHGLKRPVAADDHGDEMLTFVLQPSSYYRFENSMSCVARRLPVPADLLFLAHVRLDQPNGTGTLPMLGALTHWGFVQRSPHDQSLPIDFDTRFNGRHW